MPGCVIVVGDSRGRGVANSLSAALGPDDCAIDHTYGGARIEDLVPGIAAAVNKCHSSHSHIPKHRTVIVIIAGICSLTEKRKTSAGIEITFPAERRDVKVAQIKKALQDIWSFTRDNGIYTVTCSILPATLIAALCSNKAKGLFHPPAETALVDLLEHQQALLDAIDTINDYIRTEVAKQDIPLSIWANLHRELLYHSLKKKGTRVSSVNYRHLKDGVHADDWLQQKIVNKISTACKFLLKQSEARSKEGDNSTQSEGD